MESNTIKVLVLEDSEDDFILVSDALESSETAGFRVSHAVRLQEALELVPGLVPDVVLLDLSLPDSFGLDTFITFHRAFPDLPVVILSGLNDSEKALEAVRQGAQDYVAKGGPTNGLLVAILRHAIERQALVLKLQEALAQVKKLSGLLPICAHCKKIRDDSGYWHQVESYIRDHSDADFTHGICPSCRKKLYPGL